MGEILWGFLYAQREVARCQENRRGRVPSPAVPILRRDGSVRNTRNRKTAATRSTTGTRLYAVGTAGHGNASVTAMRQGIPSVRSAKGKDGYAPWKRYITRCLYLRVEPMRRATWFPFAKSAMRESMRSVATAGTTADRRGGQNLRGQYGGQRAWGQTHKNRKSNGGLTHAGKIKEIKCFLRLRHFVDAAFFQRKSKERG